MQKINKIALCDIVSATHGLRIDIDGVKYDVLLKGTRRKKREAPRKSGDNTTKKREI